MSALAHARLYLVSEARIGGRDLAELVPDLAGAGVDILQLRAKEMEGGDLVRVGSRLAEACASTGIRFIVNDRPDVALAVDAGVHLGQNDVSVRLARRILGGAIVGLSTHSVADIDAVLASEVPIDYIAVGPVYATPTKPGRTEVGLELIRHAAAGALQLPWFAIGGVNLSNIDAVIEAGARRVVVVRAITQAADPIVAAAELKTALTSADR